MDFIKLFKKGDSLQQEMPEYSVLIPVFNEEKAIISTIDKVKKIMDSIGSYEIICINDGSSDRSKEILDQEQGIHIIHHPENMGYGASLKHGMQAARGEYIIITDADGTYPIEDLNKLCSYLPQYDMVVGARTGQEVHIPLSRRPAKKIIGFLARILSGKEIPDLNSGLRVFKKEIAMKFFYLFPQRFSFTTTITLAFMTNNFPTKFVPINYYKREGKSTIKPIKDFINFNALIMKVMIYFRPLKMFSFVSGFLFLIALLLFIYTYFVSGKVADISIIVIVLSSIQIFLFGVLAELIVKRGMD